MKICRRYTVRGNSFVFLSYSSCDSMLLHGQARQKRGVKDSFTSFTLVFFYESSEKLRHEPGHHRASMFKPLFDSRVFTRLLNQLCGQYNTYKTNSLIEKANYYLKIFQSRLEWPSRVTRQNGLGLSPSRFSAISLPTTFKMAMILVQLV